MFKNDKNTFNDIEKHYLHPIITNPIITNPIITNNNNQNPIIYILIISTTLLLVLGFIYCIIYFI